MRRILAWLDDRTGLVSWIRWAMEHPVPPRTGWWYVFGSATFIAFLLQVVTGIALATAYVPSSGQAYDSLKFITDQALMGRFLRGMHYFGSSAMVVLIGIHVARTYLMGAVQVSPRAQLADGGAAPPAHDGARVYGPAPPLGPDGGVVGDRRRGAGGTRARDRRRARAVPPRGRHRGRRDAEPVLRLPRLLHPGDRLRASSAST